AMSGRIDKLFAFDRPESLSAEAVASLNSVLGTEWFFAARFIARRQGYPDVQCGPGTFAVETRFLHGADPQFVEILSSTDCVAGNSPAWVVWNREAFGAYAVIALFLLFPMLRGWGTLVVR